jgi:predicted TPR repeat methyltransferase
MSKADRIQKLRTLLEKNPRDAFVVYALAMEHKEIDAPQALELFRRVIEIEPNHAYAYYQLGQTHELTGDKSAAAVAYRNGLAAARRGGDGHAEQEITAAMEMIEG